VIHKVDAHQLARPLQLVGQVVVCSTGAQVARRVVVANGNDGGVGKNGFTHDNADIDTNLSDATMRDAYLFDKSMVLIHQQKPELFYVAILQDWMHMVVNLGGCT
jgi:hypothetical protein